MLAYLKRSAFNYITDDESESNKEFGLEVGLNFLFFYNALDKSEFAEHKNEWVTES